MSQPPRLTSLLAVLVVALGCGGARGPIPTSLALPAVATAPPGAEPPTLSSVPEWALANGSVTTSPTDSRYATGVGSGATLDEATRYALRDVASRISVSIESQLRDTYSETNGEGVATLEQVIETRVTGTRFTGWERTRTDERGGVFWAEVQIDRRRLARDSKAELARVANDVDLRLENAQGSALRRLLALQTTAADRDRASRLITLIAALETDFDRTPWEARRNQWRAIDEAARAALVFEVRADPDSNEIARWVESQLISERLRARPGECLGPEAICIDIRSEITEADIASRYIAKIRSTFAVLEPGGGVVQARDAVGRGDSKSDRGRARRNALEDLRRSLATLSVLDGLLER